MPLVTAGYGTACAAMWKEVLYFSAFDRGACDGPLTVAMMMKRRSAQKKNTQS